MSDWEFLWGLKGKELENAIACGMTKEDIIDLENEDEKKERKKVLQQLKELRDSGKISMEEFKEMKIMFV